MKFIAEVLNRTSECEKVFECTFIDFFLFFTSPFPSLLTFISISRRKEKWKMLKLISFLSWCFIAFYFMYRQLPLDFFPLLSDSTFFTSKPHQEFNKLSCSRWKLLNFYFYFLLHNSNRHYYYFWTYATRKKWQNNTKSQDDYIASTTDCRKRAKEKKH